GIRDRNVTGVQTCALPICFAEVAERVAEARGKLLARHAGRTVLLVSHVTPIMILVQQALLAPPEALFRMHLDVGCLSRIDCFSEIGRASGGKGQRSPATTG